MTLNNLQEKKDDRVQFCLLSHHIRPAGEGASHHRRTDGNTPVQHHLSSVWKTCCLHLVQEPRASLSGLVSMVPGTGSRWASGQLLLRHPRSGTSPSSCSQSGSVTFSWCSHLQSNPAVLFISASSSHHFSLSIQSLSLLPALRWPTLKGNCACITKQQWKDPAPTPTLQVHFLLHPQTLLSQHSSSHHFTLPLLFCCHLDLVTSTETSPPPPQGFLWM